MTSDERVLLNTLFLAVESHKKSQQFGRDRFLILALIVSARAGMAAIANRCREIVLQNSPHHLLAKFPNAIEAMQAEDFQTFTNQLQRFCTSERAEHLATGLGFSADSELKLQNNHIEQVAETLLQKLEY